MGGAERGFRRTPEPPGGGVLRYFHTYVGLGHYLGVQTFKFQLCGGGGGGSEK